MPDYTRQEFKDEILDADGNVTQKGTTIKAIHLEHIEDGIKANEKAIEEVDKKIPADYAPKDHTHSQYLTEHQRLDDYAKKNELPTKTSQLTNDSNFVTKEVTDELSREIANQTSVFYVNVSGDEESGYTADKTFAEISQAYTSGMALFVKVTYGEMPTIVPLALFLDGIAMFSTIMQNSIISLTIMIDESVSIQTMQMVELEYYNATNFSGSYHDLSYKPTIPTKTSQLTNDSGYLTSVPSEYVTETELNAKGYLTQHQSLANYYTKTETYSKSEVDTKISEISENIPSYVITEAENVMASVLAKQRNRTFTFGVVTDVHYGRNSYTDGIKHASQGLKYIHEKMPLDAIFCLGDYTDNYLSTTYDDAVADYKTFNSLFETDISLEGNHDYSTDKQGVLVRFIGAKKDIVWGSKKSLYGYRDYEEFKLRVIFLNTIETGTDYLRCSVNQYNWFINTLIDVNSKTDASEWQVLLLSHHPLDWWDGTEGYYRFGNILNAYEKGSSWTDSASAVTCNFASKNSATIIANIHGHVHNLLTDKIVVGNVNNSTTKTKINRIAIPEACYGSSNTYDGYKQGTTYSKTQNSANDTSFNVVCIDLDTYKINAICYGAGIDREVDYTPIRYTNQIPLSIGTDKKPYNNGLGYKQGYRLNSSGAEASNSDYFVTGFIPIKNYDYVYLKHMNFIVDNLTNQPNTRIATYDASFNKLRVNIVTDFIEGTVSYITNTLDEQGGTVATGDAVGKFRWCTDDNTAYIRFSTRMMTPNSIVTVNEEIE